MLDKFQDMVHNEVVKELIRLMTEPRKDGKLMKRINVLTNAGGGGSLLSGCEAPAPVRASETGRARNWTMPPLRLERECKERPNSATIDNRCVEFDRRESTESTAIIGLRALGRRIAFTMAEILLSLTIIGVVAAITLPSLTGNINERTWNTQRKALYARFSQAIALMPALNGYGTLRETTDSAGSTSIEDTAAETFVTNGLSKVLKINNICDSEHIEDCGIPSKYTKMWGGTADMPAKLSELRAELISVSYSDTTGTGSHSMLDTKAAAFETANGESILAFYNPNCIANMAENSNYFLAPKFCANFVYDLNGNKGPNTVGKDIGFMTVWYPSDSVVVAPMPYKVLNGVTADEAATACTVNAGDEYRIPTRDETGSLYINYNMLGLSTSVMYSSTKVKPNFTSELRQWVLGSNTGQYRIPHAGTTGTWDVVCVKR